MLSPVRVRKRIHQRLRNKLKLCQKCHKFNHRHIFGTESKVRERIYSRVLLNAKHCSMYAANATKHQQSSILPFTDDEKITFTMKQSFCVIIFFSTKAFNVMRRIAKQFRSRALSFTAVCVAASARGSTRLLFKLLLKSTSGSS